MTTYDPLKVYFSLSVEDWLRLTAEASQRPEWLFRLLTDAERTTQLGTEYGVEWTQGDAREFLIFLEKKRPRFSRLDREIKRELQRIERETRRPSP